MDLRQLESSRLEFIPKGFNLNQYHDIVMFKGEYFHFFLNSVKITTLVIGGQVLVGIIAAFAFAKIKFPGRDIIFLIFILVILLPFQVTLVPNYIMFDKFDKVLKIQMLDTHWAIILPGIFTSFGVFLLRQFIRDIPDELVDAAKIDGAGDLKIFFRIILPVIKPAIFTLVILSFIDNWNIIEQAVLFISSPEKMPLSLFLENIYYDDFEVFYGSGVLYMFPAIVIFIKGHKYLNEGLSVGGLK